tara:strand:- start:338 stop:739 length:402 start_codon:yes stop_codon:yes gene_type:complete
MCKMKIQLAYKFTGEDSEKLIEELKKIKILLESNGHEVYVPILDPNRPTDKKEIYFNALNKINDTDIFLPLIKSENKSEGMLMEIGHAFGAGKKVIALINKSVDNTHLRDLSEQTIEFSDIDELYDELNNFKF